MKRLVLFVTLIITSKALYASGNAAGAEHHASVFDLIAPAVNFGALFLFILWKLKTPLKKMFDQNSVNVEKAYKDADEKNKEAMIKLEMYQKKMELINSDIQNVMKETEQNLKHFRESHIEETNETISRIEKDMKNRLKYEVDSLVKEINAELISEVVSNVKQSISENPKMKKEAVEKLLAQLQ
jgi:F-type H+-transporting ATPase subunit b